MYSTVVKRLEEIQERVDAARGDPIVFGHHAATGRYSIIHKRNGNALALLFHAQEDLEFLLDYIKGLRKEKL